MGHPQPLSTPKAAKFDATSPLWMAPVRPDLRRFPRRPTPHSCHIPPALFVSGKGLWSQYESRNAVGKHAGASGTGCATVVR